jgi:hypothetical protein
MILQQYKIVFAGSMGAGKTEAIKSLSEIPVLATEAFNTDSQAHNKMQTTVGIDYGEITLDDGVKIGMSTRALGKLNEQYNGTSRVSDFRLVAVDCVADPSCPKAFVNGILESKEYVLSEDGSFEESYDKFKERISQLPRKNVEDYLKEQIIDFFGKISKVM